MMYDSRLPPIPQSKSEPVTFFVGRIWLWLWVHTPIYKQRISRRCHNDNGWECCSPTEHLILRNTCWGEEWRLPHRGDNWLMIKRGVANPWRFSGQRRQLCTNRALWFSYTTRLTGHLFLFVLHSMSFLAFCLIGWYIYVVTCHRRMGLQLSPPAEAADKFL